MLKMKRSPTAPFLFGLIHDICSSNLILMRILLIILFSISTFFVSGQNKTKVVFCDNLGTPCDSMYASEKWVYIYDDADENKGVVKKYSISGWLKSEISFSDLEELVMDGTCKYYFNNGNIKEHLNYREDKLHGEIMTYYMNGQMKRKDHFENGEFVDGKCYTQDGRDTTHFEYWLMPTYPGGDNGLYTFIVNKVKYPKKARKKGIEGTVHVKFIVNKEGNVVDARVSKSVHTLLDNEAIRVAKLLKGFTPGYHDGKKVKVWFTLPVRFQLN